MRTRGSPGVRGLPRTATIEEPRRRDCPLIGFYPSVSPTQGPLGTRPARELFDCVSFSRAKRPPRRTGGRRIHRPRRLTSLSMVCSATTSCLWNFYALRARNPPALARSPHASEDLWRQSHLAASRFDPARLLWGDSRFFQFNGISMSCICLLGRAAWTPRPARRRGVLGSLRAPNRGL